MGINMKDKQGLQEKRKRAIDASTQVLHESIYAVSNDTKRLIEKAHTKELSDQEMKRLRQNTTSLAAIVKVMDQFDKGELGQGAANLPDDEEINRMLWSM